MAKNWYIRVGDQTSGPSTTGQVIDAIEAGEIKLGHLAREQNEQTWREVGQIQSFAHISETEEAPRTAGGKKHVSKMVILMACAGIAVVGGILVAFAKGYLGGPVCEFDAHGDGPWGTYEATSCTDGVTRRIRCEIAPPDQPGFDCVCVSGALGEHILATPIHIDTDDVPRSALAWVQNNQVYNEGRWPSFYSQKCPDHPDFQGLRARD